MPTRSCSALPRPRLRAQRQPSPSLPQPLPRPSAACVAASGVRECDGGREHILRGPGRPLAWPCCGCAKGPTHTPLSCLHAHRAPRPTPAHLLAEARRRVRSSAFTCRTPRESCCRGLLHAHGPRAVAWHAPLHRDGLQTPHEGEPRGRVWICSGGAVEQRGPAMSCVSVCVPRTTCTKAACIRRRRGGCGQPHRYSRLHVPVLAWWLVWAMDGIARCILACLNESQGAWRCLTL